MNPQQYPPQQPPFQPQPPQQPQPMPPANDPYHFILNPEQPSQSRKLPRPRGILMLVALLAVVVIVLVILVAIFRGGGADTKPFVTLLQEQQEIIRISSAQGRSLQKQNVKNFVTNTELSMTSDQAKLKTFLGKNGVKVSSKQLAALASTTTDARLESAVSSSTLDATMVEVLQKELTDYQATLSQTYKATSVKSTRALLTELNNNANLLLTQSKQ
jgi:hypothetical protein